MASTKAVLTFIHHAQVEFALTIVIDDDKRALLTIFCVCTDLLPQDRSVNVSVCLTALFTAMTWLLVV